MESTTAPRPDRLVWFSWMLGVGVWLGTALVGANLGFGGLIAVAFAFAQTLQGLVIALGRHPVSAMAKSSPQATQAALWISYVSGTLIWIAVTTHNRPVTPILMAGIAVATLLTLVAVLRARTVPRTPR